MSASLLAITFNVTVVVSARCAVLVSQGDETMFMFLKDVTQGEMFLCKIGGVFQKEMHRIMTFSKLSENKYNKLLKQDKIIQSSTKLG